MVLSVVFPIVITTLLVCFVSIPLAKRIGLAVSAGEKTKAKGFIQLVFLFICVIFIASAMISMLTGGMNFFSSVTSLRHFWDAICFLGMVSAVMSTPIVLIGFVLALKKGNEI